MTMQKYIGALAAAMFISVMFTVNSGAFELSGGGRLGLGFASIIGDTTPGVSPRTGLTGCFFTTIWITPAFFLQPELGLGIKGEAAVKNINVTNPDFATSLSYCEIPVLFGWKILGKEQLQASIFAGVTPAFLLGAESVYGGGSIDMKDQTKSFDLGLTGGAAVCLKRNRAFIPVDIRYTYGASRFDTAGKNPLHNSVISISAGFGYEFTLKKEESF